MEEPPVALPSSISPRLSDILSRSRGPSGAESGTEGGEAPTYPPLHALQEEQFGEVILECMSGKVDLPVFQELEAVNLKPSIFQFYVQGASNGAVHSYVCLSQAPSVAAPLLSLRR